MLLPALLEPTHSPLWFFLLSSFSVLFCLCIFDHWFCPTLKVLEQSRVCGTWTSATFHQKTTWWTLASDIMPTDCLQTIHKTALLARMEAMRSPRASLIYFTLKMFAVFGIISNQITDATFYSHICLIPIALFPFLNLRESQSDYYMMPIFFQLSLPLYLTQLNWHKIVLISYIL